MRKFLMTFLGLFTANTALGVNLYDFTFESLEGGALPMKAYEGKVVMVVNTASHCGFTPQYAGLEQLYMKYKDQGFVLVGVPADDFGGQEFKTAAEVKAFVDENYAITFPMANITEVKGENQHPFYKWAGEQTSFFGTPKWNFHKYVFDKQGKFVGSFSSVTKPMSQKVQSNIEQLLAE